ncbi:MAG: four helix bundle protein [Lachnospiraceae bacterium]|nr:four helix bundle protein [Lachnospiraceae bacterium]
MAETELRVILKAKDLAEHTLRVTSNCNRYPKKYRFSLVDKMQIKSLNIYEALMEANRTDLRDYRHERSELQTKAITYCDELLFYIELSYKLNIISDRSMEYWSKMVSDIKHMSIAWRSKDKGRI